jgi:Family of unknown function (DUF5343)
MPDSYAYIISNNKIEPILSRVRSAAKPERFTRETLATWGFTASNDRAMVGVMKGLGFITEAGAPTEVYDRLRDPNDWKYVLAERVRTAYSDLFAIDSNMNSAPEAEIKGAMLRITGKDEESVNRYYATFKTLVGLAKFDAKPSKTAAATAEPKIEPNPTVSPKADVQAVDSSRSRSTEFHYNIQIHLPVTTDITVYNAIFRSLKENLGV